MNDRSRMVEGAALSEAEMALVAATLAGGQADLEGHSVRASVLRSLILESGPGWQLPSAGLRLLNGTVTGTLDLEGCSVPKPLVFLGVTFAGGAAEGAINLRDARLKHLGIDASRLEGALLADRVHLESGLVAIGSTIAGAVLVRGAHVAGALTFEGTALGNGTQGLRGAGLRVMGPLNLRGAKLSGELAFPRARLGALYAEEAHIAGSGFAINAKSARIDGDVLFDGSDLVGAVSLDNTRIEGKLDGSRAHISSVPVAILGDGLSVRQGVRLDGTRVRGTIQLLGAQIGRRLSAADIEIEGGEASIRADVIKVAGNWEMPRAKLVGHLAIPGATIGGQLRLTEARLYGSDVAIRADGARIRGGCFFSRAMLVGLVRIPAADIGNQFRVRGATIKVDHGAALLASGATFRRDVELNGGFQTVGAVVLEQARVHGAVDLKGSHLKSAAIARLGAPVPGAARGRAQSYRDEHAFCAVDAVIDRLQMPDRAEDRPRGIVDLARSRVGSFEDWGAAWPPAPALRAHSADGRDIDHLVLDGFEYGHLVNPSGLSANGRHARRDERVARNRIQWLEGQSRADVSEHFRPQAWVRLAERLAAQGYVDDSSRVHVARLRRERRSHSASFGARWQNRLLDWFALYGFNPWRTIAWMVLLVLVFAGLWALAARQCGAPGCFDEAVFVVSRKGDYTTETFPAVYPPFNPLGYSFDLFVPVVGFGYEDHWRANVRYAPLAEIEIPDPWRWLDPARPATGPPAVLQVSVGSFLYLLAVIEMLIGLVLTSLAITGFTGLLRGGS